MQSTIRVEEARIRAAYAERRSSDTRYSWFQSGYVLESQERERQVLALLRRHGLSSLGSARILEVGCGSGGWLRELIKWGAQPENITGVDLLHERLVQARRLCPAALTLACGNAAELPVRDRAFDLVVQSTVFTSILDPEVKRQVASEMLRAVKDEGLILWYDFHVDNPRNRDVRGVNRREIHQLFPQCRIELRRITLAPPLARALAPHSLAVCSLLGRLPWLCTHYLGTIRKAHAHMVA